jgi:lipopolysaccharide/colanic/teichoic acid biosynthesis glycosyltransferase
VKEFSIQLFFIFLAVFLVGYFIDIRLYLSEIIYMLISYLLTLWMTHKHKPKYHQKIPKYILSPFYKSYAVQLFLAILLFVLSVVSLVGLQVITMILLIYALIELSYYYFIITLFRPKGCNLLEFSIKKYNQKKINISELNCVDLKKVAFSGLFDEEILHKIYKCDEDRKTGDFFIYTSDWHGIKDRVDLIIISIKLNNVIDINNILIEVYKHLNNGGSVIISYKDIKNVQKNLKNGTFFDKVYRFIKYYIFDIFLLKVALVKAIYRALFKEYGRTLSKAEVWGRLAYNGFDVKNEIEISGNSFLVAHKELDPSKNPNPSKSLLIKLDRVGFRGEIVKIHKVRSMYPYSEFLQKKIYNMSSLGVTGKFNKDFRIMRYGAIFRKYWIDELPQLIDWFRGDIKLVGIRAMSLHFFSLYTKEYQDLYHKVKPGIISPIFDDKTDGFETIQKIEQEYLERYLKEPIKTDFIYFFITIKHILKGIRSK